MLPMMLSGWLPISSPSDSPSSRTSTIVAPSPGSSSVVHRIQIPASRKAMRKFACLVTQTAHVARRRDKHSDSAHVRAPFLGQMRRTYSPSRAKRSGHSPHVSCVIYFIQTITSNFSMKKTVHSDRQRNKAALSPSFLYLVRQAPCTIGCCASRLLDEGPV